MTREKRLELLKQIEKDINVPSIESTFLDDAKSCAIHSAIEELEQEPILDKVKEVVAKWKADDFTGSDGFAWDCMKEIADIVDKGESEGT